jgi:hypothetical protein
MGWLVFGAAVFLLGVVWVSMVRAGTPSFQPVNLPGGGARDVALGPPGCVELVDCSDVPLAVASGDFDGDGNADVATANVFSADVTILLGDGTGNLTFGAVLRLAEPPIDVAAGDLDEDGTVDLVLAIEAAEALIVALGNGDGTFRIAQSLSLRGSPPAGANPPSAVEIADLDRNGLPDLIATSLLANKVTVLLGEGRGEFGAPRITRVDGGPIGLAVGELTGDQRRDVVVSLDAVDEVQVLTGDGGGGLALGTRVPVGQGPGPVVIADFNRDGRRDVAVATDAFDAVFVLLGRGDGTFEAAEEFEVGTSPTALVAADFDGDGRLDLLTTDNFGSLEFRGAGVGDADDSVSVLVGRGDGRFDVRRAFAVNVAPADAVVVDLNGDRKPDVVTANMESNDVSVLLNATGGADFRCTGDCDRDGRVTVAELLTGVDLFLREAGSESCSLIDRDEDGVIGLDELIAAVGDALNGCTD